MPRLAARIRSTVRRILTQQPDPTPRQLAETRQQAIQRIDEAIFLYPPTADIEAFLRHSNLTYALDSYIRAQASASDRETLSWTSVQS